MKGQFAITKRAVAVVLSTLILPTVYAENSIIDKSFDSGDETIVITPTWFGGVTVDAAWREDSAPNQPNASNTVDKINIGTKASIKQTGGNSSLPGFNAYFGIFIGAAGQAKQITVNGTINTSVGVYNDGWIGEITDKLVNDINVLTVGGTIDTSYYGEATKDADALAIQNAKYGKIYGSILLDETAQLSTATKSPDFLNAGKLYGNFVSKSSSDIEVLIRKVYGGAANGEIFGSVINNGSGTMTVYNEGGIYSGVINDGKGKLILFNENVITGIHVIVTELYNIPESSYKSEINPNGYPGEKTNGIAKPEIKVTNLTVTGRLDNYSVIIAGTADITNLTQKNSDASLKVDGTLTLKGENSSLEKGTASAGSMMVSKDSKVTVGTLCVGSGSSNLSVTDKLTIQSGGLLTATSTEEVIVNGTLDVTGSLVSVGSIDTGSSGFLTNAKTLTVGSSGNLLTDSLSIQDASVFFRGSSTASNIKMINLSGGTLEVTDSAVVATTSLTLTYSSTVNISSTLSVGFESETPGLSVTSDLTVFGSVTAGSLDLEDGKISVAADGKLVIGSAVVKNSGILSVVGSLQSKSIEAYSSQFYFYPGSNVNLQSLSVDDSLVVVNEGVSIVVNDPDGTVAITNASSVISDDIVYLGADAEATSKVFSIVADNINVKGYSQLVATTLVLANPETTFAIDENGHVQVKHFELKQGKLEIGDGVLEVTEASSELIVADGTTVTIKSNITLTDNAGISTADDDNTITSGLITNQKALTISGNMSFASLNVLGDSAKTVTVADGGVVSGTNLIVNNASSLVTFESGSKGSFSNGLTLTKGKVVLSEGSNVSITGDESKITVASGARLEVDGTVLVGDYDLPEGTSGLVANTKTIDIYGEADAKEFILNHAGTTVTLYNGSWGYLQYLNLQHGNLNVQAGALLEMGPFAQDRRSSLGISTEDAVLDHNDHRPMIVNQSIVTIGTNKGQTLNPGDIYFGKDSNFVIDTKYDLGTIGILHSDHEGSNIYIEDGAKLTVVSAAMGRHLLVKGFKEHGYNNWNRNLTILNQDEKAEKMAVMLDDEGNIILDVPVPEEVDDVFSVSDIFIDLVEGDDYELRGTESPYPDVMFVTRVVEPGYFSVGNDAGIDVNKSAKYYNSVVEFGAASGFRPYVLDQVQTMADIRERMLAEETEPGKNLWGTLIATRSGINNMRTFGALAGGYRANTVGLVLGNDFISSESLRIGASAHYLKGNLRSHGDYLSTKTRAHIFGLSFYGAKRWGAASILSQISWSNASGRGHQNFSDLLGNDYSIFGKMVTNSYLAGVRAQYDFKISNVIVAPHVGVRYIGNRYSGYDVKINGAAAFRSSARKLNQIQTPIGITSKAHWETPERKWNSFVDLSYVPQMGRKRVTGVITAKNLGVSDEYVQELSGKWYANLALGLNTTKGPHRVKMTYNANIGDKNYRSHGFMVRYGYSF